MGRSELRAVALLLVGLLAAVVLAVTGTSSAAAEDPSTEITSSPSASASASASAEPSQEPSQQPSSEPSATTSGSPSPSVEPSEVPETAFEVDDALLRWGVNNESNNRGAAPGTFNFFSAGKLGDPGEGGQLLTDATTGGRWANGRTAGWKASAGNVRIEKLRGDGSYGLATWAGLKTDRDGESLGGYAVNTKFSDHQVVLSGGTGTVDPGTRSATIRWDGDFTIVFYSGYTFFSVSDPVLSVVGGTGKLTGTLSGYSSSMDDLSQWGAVAPRTGVVLADLGTVDLGTELGFTAKPKYLGVKVSGADQVAGGEHFGSFPQSFIDFQKVAGAAAYWYSSGGSLDRNKPALPLAVSYAAGSPIIPETPEGEESPAPTVQNSAPPPPVQPRGPVLPQQPSRPNLPAAVPAGVEVPFLAAVEPVATVLPAVLPAPPASEESGSSAPWIAGLVLLVLAALTAASPTLYQLTRKP